MLIDKLHATVLLAWFAAVFGGVYFIQYQIVRLTLGGLLKSIQILTDTHYFERLESRKKQVEAA